MSQAFSADGPDPAVSPVACLNGQNAAVVFA